MMIERIILVIQSELSLEREDGGHRLEVIYPQVTILTIGIKQIGLENQDLSIGAK